MGIREGRKGGTIEKGEEVGNRKSICLLVGFKRNWDTEGAHPKRSRRDGDASSISREWKQMYLIDLKLLLAGATQYGTSNQERGRGCSTEGPGREGTNGTDVPPVDLQINHSYQPLGDSYVLTKGLIIGGIAPFHSEMEILMRECGRLISGTMDTGQSQVWLAIAMWGDGRRIIYQLGWWGGGIGNEHT